MAVHFFEGAAAAGGFAFLACKPSQPGGPEEGILIVALLDVREL